MRWAVCSAAAAVALTVLLAAQAASARADGIVRISPGGAQTRFPVPLGSTERIGPLAAGPDGAMWFVVQGGDALLSRTRIGRLAPDGKVQLFSSGIPDDALSLGITAGSDGNLWFPIIHTSAVGNEPDGFGRITAAGAVTVFAVPNFDGAGAIASGSDGRLWTPGSSGVASINPAGSDPAVYFASEGRQRGIAAGPDGNLWMTGDGDVSRVSPGGVISSFSDGLLRQGLPRAIAAGPDGKMWFGQLGRTTSFQPAVGRISPSGHIDQIPVAAAVAGLARAPNNTMWGVTELRGFGTSNKAIVDIEGGEVVQIAPSGAVSDIELPCVIATQVAAGRDGTMWVADDNSFRCPPVQLDIAGRGTISRRGVATLNVFCSGGDPRDACTGISLGLIATIRSGRRRRLFNLGTATATVARTGSKPGPVATVKLPLRRSVVRALRRSRVRTVRVRARARFGTARTQRRPTLDIGLRRTRR